MFRIAPGQLWSSKSKSKSMKKLKRHQGFLKKIVHEGVPWVIRLSFGAAPLGKV